MIEFFYSDRFFDLARFLAVVGTAFVVFVRIGSQLERIARLRLAAYSAIATDAREGDAPPHREGYTP